jgi:16S rRNA (guanine527-N7)-methyltransferase
VTLEGDETSHVSRETRSLLTPYVELLLAWNRTINLISKADEAHVWTRHVADAVQLVPLLPPRFSHGIDLGSGAGFPGLVLAALARRPFHLIEADQRKCAFLREAARAAGAPVIIHAMRIERARPPPAPVVTARALAPLDTLLAWTERLLAPGGICLFPKGRNAREELTLAAKRWQMRCEETVSHTDQSATILRISEIARVGPHA